MVWNQLFLAVGVLVVTQTAYSFLRLAVIYFGPSRVKRYLHSPNSYALITGATDGIGKAVAKELYQKGFNLILHGRNEEKLRKVQEEIESSGGAKDIKLWVVNANEPAVDFEAAAAQWVGLEVTLVINNVGSAPVRQTTIDGIPSSELLNDVQRNALFPLLLTRAVLPILRRLSGPTEIVFVGSLSSAYPIPRIIPYGATKSFLRQLSGALGSDEAFRLPHAPNVSTIYMDVGSVTSASHKAENSLFTPSSEVFGKHFVQCIGCGLPAIIPYWLHALQACSAAILPESMLKKELFKAMDKELTIAKKD